MVLTDLFRLNFTQLYIACTLVITENDAIRGDNAFRQNAAGIVSSSHIRRFNLTLIFLSAHSKELLRRNQMFLFLRV